ncbi:MAG: hypothetical protein WCP34_16780 [Pseudomonadota bacterium]
MGESQVGIFFVVDNQLLMDAVPVAQGEAYGETLGHGGHYDFWEQLAPSNAIERTIKARAYDAYPRGRVVYFTQKQRFVLYADKCLKRDRITWIAGQFGLVAPVFRRDHHYQCATCNASFIDDESYLE